MWERTILVILNILEIVKIQTIIRSHIQTLVKILIAKRKFNKVGNQTVTIQTKLKNTH